MTTENTARDFLSFQAQAPTAWHAAAALAERLTEQGFVRLRETDRWDLVPGGRYLLIRNGSSLIAFTLPQGRPARFLIAAAHSDSPAFKVKANPELPAAAGCVRLDTERYGGMIFSSWFDRPLSIAGRLLVREEGRLVSRLVKAERDLCVIPNVAIHMNREVNSGYAYQPHVDLMPLWGGDPGSFLPAAAEAAGVAAEDVVSHDLFLYNRMPGCVWGTDGRYLSAGRLDDLECAWAGTEALAAAAAPTDHVSVLCVFDNEEVGSGTRQGADSTLLSDVLERAAAGLGLDAEDTRRMLAESFLVSADNAHAVHPNHPELSDPVNRAQMNAGVVIKHSAAQKYTTDAVSCGVFAEICRRAGVPVQHYANRSDIPGGSTLGHIALRHVSVPALDIGLAQLAMHSAWETAGARDLPMLVTALKAFYETPLRPEDGGFRLD